MTLVALPLDNNDISPFSYFGGRTNEMSKLQLRLDQAMEGNGQSILITGSAGLGKTRLLQEFLGGAKEQYRDFLVIKHSFFPKGTTQDQLFGSLFEQCRNFLPLSSENIQQQCAVIAEKIGLRQPLMLQVLHYLSGSQEPHENEIWDELDQITKKALASSVIWDFINYVSTIQPVIISIEDIHWADSELKFILQNLQEKLSSRRIFVILTARESLFADQVQDYNSIEAVKLLPLSSLDQLSLLDHWLGTSPTLKAIKREISTVAAGSPFLLREIALTLEDNESLSGEAGKFICIDKNAGFAIPPTLHTLMERRLQSLSHVDRLHISYAAAIGQRFRKDLLIQVLGSDEVFLRRVLVRLARQNIIFPVINASVEQWQFSHSLIHEMAYGMCSPEEKRRIHSDIFGILQKMQRICRKERDVSLYAYHAFKAGLDAESFLYNYLAGNAAVNEAESANAITHFENAIYSLEQLPADHANKERYLAKCRMGLALALSMCGRHCEARDIIRSTEQELSELEKRSQALENKIQVLSLFDLWIQGDLVKGIETGKHILETIDIQKDTHNYITAAIRLAGMLQDHGRYDDSNKVLEVIQPLFNEENMCQRYGLLFSASTLCYAMMARNHGELGDFEAAERCAIGCMRFTSQNNNPLATIYWLSYASTFFIRAGRFTDAIPFYAEAFEICGFLKTNLLYPFVAAHYGYALFHTGAKAEGIALMEEACAIARKQTAHGREALYMQMLAEAHLIDKNYERAKNLSSEAIAIGMRYREDANVAHSWYILGQVYLETKMNESEGMSLINASRKMFEELGLKPLIASCDVILDERKAA